MVEMKHLSPTEVIERKIVTVTSSDQLQQVGIDLTIPYNVEVPAKGFINIAVKEHFDMQDCFGIVNIRSSFSRIGLFCSAGIYDPGFSGIGGLTIYNFGDKRFLPAGTRIAQILVFAGTYSSKYDGEYNTKTTIESKLKTTTTK